MRAACTAQPNTEAQGTQRLKYPAPAACPNAAAMLFTAAKVSQFALLPQGQPERLQRVQSMVNSMDEEGFGNCTNHYECMAACPKGIDVEHIARMNRDYLRASLTAKE